MTVITEPLEKVKTLLSNARMCNFRSECARTSFRDGFVLFMGLLVWYVLDGCP